MRDREQDDAPFEGVKRYDRQERLAEIGPEGQRKLAAGSVLIVGCGALGSASAELLARAGVGRLSLVDRDVVELSNLHRQLLYDEEDARQTMPKAAAAARHLARINAGVRVEARAVDVGPQNIGELLDGVDLVLDGTDNVETRYLLNDACLERGLPWIYAGAVGTQGVTMSIVPPDGPCLRCVFPDPAPPGSLPTCDTRGVLNVVTVMVAAAQVADALKLLVGAPDFEPRLLTIEPWRGSYRTLRVRKDPECPACVHREWDFLAGYELTEVVRLCGRNAVQVDPVGDLGVGLDVLARRLEPLGRVSNNGHIVRFEVEGFELLVFEDGRALVRGTTDPVVAKNLYARYVGS